MLAAAIEVPALLAVVSAFLFALGAQLTSLGLRTMDSRSGSVIAMFSSAAIYWCLAPFYVELKFFFTWAAIVFASVGLFRPLFSSNLANAGNKYLGPTRSTTLASISPFFAVFMGLAFLGEQLTWPIFAGTTLIVAGIMLLSSGRARGPEDWMWWAIWLPIGAAFFRSLAHVFTKYGMEELPSPFFAGMMSYSVSFFIAMSSEGFRAGGLRQRFLWPDALWFIAAGLANGVSILILNQALKVGTLIEVSPIVSCSPVFTLLLSIFIFRRERITRWLVLSLCLVVPGAIMIILR